MNSSLAKRLSTSIAIVALAGLLAFGGGIRYLCYCSGEVVVTVHEHCHDGGASHDSHVSHSHTSPDHRHDDHGSHPEEPGEHGDHHHDLVKTPTDLRAPSIASAPELKLLPLLQAPLPVEAVVGPFAPRAEWTFASRFADPPPQWRDAVRSVVFLI
ncbi:MAG: hypothetical protein KDN18_13625 [Verrucomicrobiae bacterium]|nr:hypothetical protein [Verrucomicrobiae bacterium]